MPRRAGLSSQLHGVARSSHNFRAARESPGLYAERLARRNADGKAMGATGKLLRSSG
jgi:hypothetical protein